MDHFLHQETLRMKENLSDEKWEWNEVTKIRCPKIHRIVPQKIVYDVLIKQTCDALRPKYIDLTGGG